MLKKALLITLLLSLILAACSNVTETASPAPTESQDATPYPEPVQPTDTPSGAEPYPEPPVVATEPPAAAPYPEPGEEVAMPTVGPNNEWIYTSGYEPQPGDERLKLSEINIEMAQSSIQSGDPVVVILKGYLPDPCHVLRVKVNPADTQNKINLEVYGLNTPGKGCITMIQPYEAHIELVGLSAGKYTVLVNTQPLGDFTK